MMELHNGKVIFFENYAANKLMRAVKEYRVSYVIQYLLIIYKKININIRDSFGDTP